MSFNDRGNGADMASNDTTSEPTDNGAQEADTPARRFEDLPPAARRALKEAEARRAEIDRFEADAQAERGGRGGKDPARYGDWEIKGLAIDF